METHEDAGPRFSHRLRARIPELMIEAFSVMLAVLIALAVDEWREERANRELAAKARANILEEIRANRGELTGAGDANAALLERLAAYGAAESTPPESLNVNFEYALLSTAAWQTAQMTRAAHFMDYEWTAEVARTYDLQELYDRAQTAVVEHMSRGALGEGELPGFLGTMRAQVELVATLHDGLASHYAELLKETGNGDAQDAEME